MGSDAGKDASTAGDSGSAGGGDASTGSLLVLSQVVLSLQLPFAVIPLVLFTGSRARMGAFASPSWLKAAAWTIAATIVALNVAMLAGTLVA